MRWLLALCIIQTFVCLIKCKNNFYTLKWERLEYDNGDYDYFNVTGGCTFYNRTVKALNIVIQRLKPFPEQSTVVLLANKWINNNWVRYSSIQITDTLKGFMSIEWFDMQHYWSAFTPPIKHPWPKGAYVLKDFLFNADKWPPYIPTGYYKGAVTFYESKKKEKMIVNFDFYLHLIPIIKH